MLTIRAHVNEKLGDTALCSAAANLCPEIVSALLSVKAAVDLRGARHFTPLMAAVAADPMQLNPERFSQAEHQRDQVCPIFSAFF